jgi:hypothetical protein
LCSELTAFISQGLEIRVGLRGLRKMFYAQSYRRFAEKTFDIARVFIVSSQLPQEITDLTPRRTISDSVRDIAFSKVPQGSEGTHDESSEAFPPDPPIIAAADVTGIPQLRGLTVSPFSRAYAYPRLGHSSVRLVISEKGFAPPAHHPGPDLPNAVVDLRFRVDVKVKITLQVPDRRGSWEPESEYGTINSICFRDRRSL